MSQIHDDGLVTKATGAALAAHRRVKNTAGTLSYCDASTVGDGTLLNDTFANANKASGYDDGVVILWCSDSTRKFVALDTITEGDPIYAAANGKVSASGSVIVGRALEDAVADDIFEGYSIGNANVSTSVGGTTAAAFLVDSDATTPKIELSGQSGGTGDFKVTIKPPATITGNRVKTFQNDANASIKDDYTFTATAAADESAGSLIPTGARQVAVTAVANDANDWVRLPAIAEVNIGDQIVIACNASSNFELRTVASSNTTINGQDSDGTKEYLCTDTDVVIVTKATATGWIAQSLTSLGAVRTAVVPD